MTRNVVGRMSEAPATPALTSPAEKVEAVAAATMPRGATHPTNTRSLVDRWLRSVARKVTSGRAEEAIELGSKVGALVGLGIEGEEGMEAGAVAGAEAAAEGVHPFSEE